MAPFSSKPTRDARGSAATGGAGTDSVLALTRTIELGVAAGVSRRLLLDAAGITEEDLRDPDRRIPVAAKLAVWEALAKTVNDPAFGVRAGARALLPHTEPIGYIACFGLLGYLVGFSATLREGLQRAARYGRILSEEVALEVAERDREVTLSIRRLVPGPGQPIAEDFRLATWTRLCREMTGAQIVPLMVRFTHPAPGSTLVYREHFRCPLEFDAPEGAIVLRPADADLPVLRANEALAGYLSAHADRFLQSLVAGESWRHTVRAAIWSLLADGRPSLTRVASALGVSPRTLQRRLAIENTTLLGEIEEIRKNMAMAMLRERSLSIAEVSMLLGYAEPSAFFRSFRRWTGTTPRDYRRAAA